MSDLIKAILFHASLGAVFGLVPLVCGLLKKQKLPGILGMALCVVLAPVCGFYFTIPIAALFTFLVFKLDQKKRAAQEEKNRKEYAKTLAQRKEQSLIEPGTVVENPKKASEAWPPIKQAVDEEALREYEEQLKAENEAKALQKQEEPETEG